MDRWTAYFHMQIGHGHLTDAVLMNTVDELEPTGLAMTRRTLGEKVPVFPIGPLVCDVSADDDGGGIMSWLDSQAASSVLYISFGSQNSIRPEQMLKLATALESTCRPFRGPYLLLAPGPRICVDRPCRPPVGQVDGRDECMPLPEGFEARARAASRGVVVHGWAPQVRILAHGSTGAFLSHCGWNSVLESLAHGVPILGWPISAELFYNSKMLVEEWGMCVEVARGNQPDSPAVESGKVAEVVETVMGRSTAAEMRQRVAVVLELMKRAWAEDVGSSTTALREFLRATRLQCGRREKRSVLR
ncbi:hypothetical protein ACQ4PT_030502 [Festuca glaucescens]